MKIMGKIKGRGLGGAASAFMYKLFGKTARSYYRKHVPIDNKQIMFVSKPDFSDNSKAMYLYLLKEHPEMKFVWALSEDINKNYPNTKFINGRKHPFKIAKETLASRAILFTHGLPAAGTGRRDGQLVINLWHGCGYKDSVDRGKSWMERKQCDFSLVPGDVFVKTKSKVWGCPADMIWPIGYPRYDWLLKGGSEAEKFAAKLKGSMEKLVIWMPTFRNSQTMEYPEGKVERNYDLPLLSSDEQLVGLDRLCGQMKIRLCIKRHPSQKKYSCEDIKLENIIFLENNDFAANGIEMYSFLHYTDGLVSDYSSIAIDYMLLDRPIAFSLDDLEDYRNSRGFVFEDPLEYMPGHHLYKYEDLIKYFEDIFQGRDDYRQAREKLMPEVHNVTDNYCRRAWDMIASHLE